LEQQGRKGIVFIRYIKKLGAEKSKLNKGFLIPQQKFTVTLRSAVTATPIRKMKRLLGEGGSQHKHAFSTKLNFRVSSELCNLENQVENGEVTALF